MATFTHVLMATDLDARSDAAARFALSLAKDQDATVTFVHVYPMPLDVYGMYALTLPISSEELDQAAQKATREWLGRLGMSTSLETVVRAGDATTMIIEEVRRQKADLVVVGTRARHGVSHVLLGSTAEKLVRLCPVPVLVAHSS